jgi:RNA polymerase sigma factor (sigma-70 family)
MASPVGGSRFCLSGPGFWLALDAVDAALDSTAGGRPHFLTTQWGLITASAQGSAEARAALEGLYRAYCYPVYAFIRRRGYGRPDAQDLTQDFFLHLLETGALGRADPQRGRFRSFLLGALDHFLAHAAERAATRKRGGGCQMVFLDDDTAEAQYQLAAPEGLTAEALFDARWALTLLERALATLRRQYALNQKEAVFEALGGFVAPQASGGGPETSYEAAARALGVGVGTVKTLIYRLRKQYLALVREEVARTVADPAEVEDELRALYGALMAAQGRLEP